MPDSSRLITLGVIIAAHGIRGQVKIRVFTEQPKNLTAYGALQDKHGRQYHVTTEGGSGEILIASIRGITDRNQAELLRNTELCVPRSALPDLSDNAYYHEDLIGMDVQTADGKAYGNIKSVHNYGAGDVLTIELTNGEEEIFPLTQQFFPEIDLANAIAIISPPDIIK